MAKWNFPRIPLRIWQILLVGLICLAAVTGGITGVHPVQAAGGELTVAYIGDDLPAVLGTAWSRTYSASGGTAPYTCSMSGSIPGLTFQTSTCTLSGTPTEYGVFSVTISFQDDANPKNTGSATLDFTAEAATVVSFTLQSDHPGGTSHYVAGFPIWVNVQVDFSPTISGEKPTGSVAVTSGVGGPTCSAALDSNGQGECALIFPTSGSKTIQVDYTSDNTYFQNSSDSNTITVGELEVTSALSTGRNHTCWLSSSGRMSCWGLSDGYPAGDPTILGPFSKISSGGYQTCGLNMDGTISCWGDNTDVTLNIPSGNYVNISAGDEHVCAIDVNRILHCWGNLTTALQAVPTEKVTTVSAGITHDCAILKSTSKPVCWGSSTSAPNLTLKSLEVGNTHACGLKTDGSITCWGPTILTPPSGTTYTVVDSGSNYSCAKKTDGKISCWGSGNPGVDTATVFDQFSSGFLHSCALKPAGASQTLSCWGDNTYGKAPAITLSPTTISQYLGKDKPFSQSFSAAGGNEPYTIAVSSGSLPAGVTLSGADLSGSPSVAGTFNFSLSAAETFPGSGLPLALSPKVQNYSTSVIDGTTTLSISLPASVDAGSPALVRVTVNKIPSAPQVTGDVLVSSSDSDASCRATLDLSGVAECTLYFSVFGTQTVTAAYEGDIYYKPSNETSSILVNSVEITPAIGSGDQFSCTIDGTGKLACWGKDDSFQSSNPAAGVFDQLDLGKTYGCALGLNRMVKCWGNNTYGVVSTIPATTDIARVTSGNTHSCLMTKAGFIQCWGNSALNRLSVPNPGFLRLYTGVDAGNDHTCGLVDDGSVRCWGVNTYGQTTIPADLLTRGIITKISSGGTFTCGLHEDGSLECWGGNGVVDSIRTEPTGEFADVSAGGNFACAINASGAATCWGGLATAPAGSFTRIASGADHVCGILTNGTMQCWGNNSSGQAPVVSISPASLPQANKGVTWSAQTTAAGGRDTQYSYSISSGSLPNGLTLNSTSGLISGTPAVAGVYPITLRAQEADHNPALTAEKSYTLTVRGLVDAKIDTASPSSAMAGSPVLVNFSVHAQSGDSMGVEPTGMVTVSAEGNECQVNLLNGVGSCWMLFATSGTKEISIVYPGDELYQQGNNQATAFEYIVSPFVQTPQLRTGLDHTYIYKADGTLGCVGVNCALTTLTGAFVRLGVGDDYACGLRTNGNVVCVSYGGASLPLFEEGPYIDLSVGEAHVCALRIGGQVECQGSNASGQTSAPVGLFSILSAGGGHTCALNNSGEAACWGAINAPPAGAFTQLVSGSAHSCGLRSNGSVECWGDNSSGQSTVPVSPASFSLIAAGGNQTCGLDASGAATCWGDDSAGQTNSRYGSFVGLATYDNHACGIRAGNKLTCWGQDDAGEAPQYSFTPITVLESPVYTYYEHRFDIAGGAKPIAVSVEGALPPGMEVDPTGSAVAGIIPEIVINDLSPAGMIFYGTPNVPGAYPFVLRWTDASLFPLVMEQPYTLTITGGDLALDLAPFSPVDALQNNEYRFKVVVSVNTSLAIPDVVAEVTLPVGLSNMTVDDPDCSISGQMLTCQLDSVAPGSPHIIWVSGKVTAEKGETLDFSGSVETTRVGWPETAALNNTDSFSTQVAWQAEVLNEVFDQSPFDGWTGGSPLTAPNGQTILSGSGEPTLYLDLDGLPAHKNVILSFDLYVIGGWLGNNPDGDPSQWFLGQVGFSPLLDTSFCNDLCQQAYPGWLPGSSFPARFGSAAQDELGFEVSGVPVPDTRYPLRFKFTHTAEDLHLFFSSLNLPDGASWAIDNLVVEVDAGYTQLYLPAVIR